jgi:hypothetical protein
MIAKLLAVHPKRQEAIGTAIALLAAFWEFTAIRASTKHVETPPILEITDKLNHLWNAHGAPNTGLYVAEQASDFHRFDYLQNRKKIEDAFWIGPLGTIRTILFVIGGVLVVSAKWREGSKQKQ